MKIRECDKPQGSSFIPKRSHDRFTESELQFLVELKMMAKHKGYKTSDIARMFNTRFEKNKTQIQIGAKLFQLKKSGYLTNVAMPSSDDLMKYTTSYGLPENTSQALKQIEIAMTILQNSKEFIQKMQSFEMSAIETVAKFDKMKSILGIETSREIN